MTLDAIEAVMLLEISEGAAERYLIQKKEQMDDKR